MSFSYCSTSIFFQNKCDIVKNSISVNGYVVWDLARPLVGAWVVWPLQSGPDLEYPKQARAVVLG